ncbi:MAG TPA: hypothetical protein VJ793_23765 [Anaerolineae bacterium]|nr:hypothetical protein [Anaerolineae bacterium]
MSRLREWHAASVAFLAQLRLTAHGAQPQPRPASEGVPFLGFTMYPTHRRLKRRKVVYAARRLTQRRNQVHAGLLPLDAFRASVLAWIAHARHGDTWGLRRSVLRRLVV